MSLLWVIVVLTIGLVVWRAVDRHRTRPLMAPQELGRVLDEARRKTGERQDPPDQGLA